MKTKKFSKTQMANLKHEVRVAIARCKHAILRNERWDELPLTDTYLPKRIGLCLQRWHYSLDVAVELDGDDVIRVTVAKKRGGGYMVEMGCVDILTPVHLQIVNAVAEAVFGK